MRCSILLAGLILALPGLLPALALADGPIEGNSGMARMVDGPALRTAFTHAHAGEVEIAFEIGDDGAILRPHIVRSEPAGVFDAAALSMIEHARLPKESASTTAGEQHLVIRFRDDADPQTTIESTK